MNDEKRPSKIDLQNIDHQLEIFLAYKLGHILKMSPSRRVAMSYKFGSLRDYAQPLVENAPDTFAKFVSEIEKRFREVSKFRAPKGHRAVQGVNEFGESYYYIGKIRGAK